jgi:starch phosphorylase
MDFMVEHTMTKETLENRLTALCGKEISACSEKELYTGLLSLVQEMAKDKESNQGKKKLYYISAEFLIGKLLSNNMINLGIYDTVKNLLEENGKSLSAVEETEPEPSLGNGGLGRLAACFLDSIATLGLNGDGVGLNYHFGLFKQLFKDNKQAEEPNPWIENTSWLTKTDVTYKVPYKNFTLTSRMYDIEVTGYNNRTNKLHLFDVETVDESIVEDGISFDKTDIAKNLTLFLYPDDSDKEGRILRIYQQYFMVSNAARLILDEAITKGSTLYDLADYAVIQINDTHPTMVIPELIRLLTTEHNMEMDDAIEVVSHCCAYTNHTILAEALEKWPVEFFKEAVPQLLPIMEVLDDKVRRKFDDTSVYIIDKNDLVHMAHIDIHYGFSVNGVAALHTDILKETELNNFYKLYPEKFNNKTNGITFRRWLLHSNPELTNFITEFIGDGFKKDAEELKKLDTPVITKNLKQLYRLLDIKAQKKAELAKYLEETQGITINPDSIFDIQIKRLHEYKRQQMNALYLIHKYLEIKKGKKPTTPITAIFGAKAAPAYIIAKDIIHMILCLQQIIDKDPEVKPYLNVVMVNNYNVTLAEKLIPACDISEQISLASKEASGTGNMKFMLNGAVTLGTDDGANVEIHELVGDDNIYIFGDSSETVIERYKKANYCSKDYYDADPAIKEAVDFIISKKMLAVGDKENLERLYKELLTKDWFMTFPDFKSYCEAKEKAFADYEDRTLWARKMLVNISQAGYFSSDRTIGEYDRDIWKLR